MRQAPLLDPADPARRVLWTRGRATTVAQFSAEVAALAAALPQGTHLANLCERRDLFLLAYCAALARGQTNLLPPSRAPLAIEECMARYPGSYRCDDATVERTLGGRSARPPRAAGELTVAGAHVAQIVFTSGSTGVPRAHVKRWRNLLGSTRFNAERVRACLAPRYGGAPASIVATVPAQHMYGTETSVLLPLLAGMAVHGGRPLFPADVAAALAEVPPPRVLVTTPVHLRSLVAASVDLPEVGVVISATAPLERELARAVERALGATLLEMFGSTETCVIATRLTAREDAWRLYPGVKLAPSPDGATVTAPWFDAATTLADVIELVPPDGFVVRGRNVDMIEVAGKRASLADLTRRILDIPGVRDAIVFQAQPPHSGAVRRVAALVVAPGLAADAIAAHLSRSIDSAFMPRPLLIVPALPRNELGKLSHEALQALAAPHCGTSK